MSHILFSIWLAAAGAVAATHEQPAVTEHSMNRPSAPGQQIAALSGHRAAHAATPAPVTAVTALRRLPDGSVSQQCDVLPAHKAAVAPQSDGVWIQVPEARIR